MAFVTEQNAIDLLEAANYFKCDRLKAQCEDVLRQSKSRALLRFPCSYSLSLRSLSFCSTNLLPTRIHCYGSLRSVADGVWQSASALVFSCPALCLSKICLITPLDLDVENVAYLYSVADRFDARQLKNCTFEFIFKNHKGTRNLPASGLVNFRVAHPSTRQPW